jgi:hypothetical protein
MKLAIYQQKESLGIYLLNAEITNTINVREERGILQKATTMRHIPRRFLPFYL